MNLLIGGIAVARFTTAACPAITSARPARSKIDTRTGSVPRSNSSAAFSGERASAVTA